MLGSKAERELAEDYANLLIAERELLDLARAMRACHPELLERKQLMQSRVNFIKTAESAAKLLRTLRESFYGRSDPPSDY